jgi:hypothetical protein
VRLNDIYVRFYRSFNYDYERKWHRTSEAMPWEQDEQGWFPFVRVKIEPEITAVIGANEAGKTQLLNTIESAITGKNINPSDFCRYSVLHSVQTGEVRSPEFGARLTVESAEEAAAIHAAIKDIEISSGDQISLFRPGTGEPFVLVGQSREPLKLTAPQTTQFAQLLPPIYRMQTELAMPDSMSIAELAGRQSVALNSRRRRSKFLRTVTAEPWASGEAFLAAVFPSWQTAESEALTEAEIRRREEFELGRKLLIEIARIDQESFARLELAIENEREGEIEGLIGAMNAAIAENLNFHRWWRQDINFDIEVKARERELALVIRDRTKSSYSFDERSQGLRYFLSYYVQMTAHQASMDRSEVMLLDEPDAYLSSIGQQDLLRVLQNYAVPETDAPPNQVVYVTHSPFLIDRNFGHRIRVLDKGAEDEGTRVIKDATQNHYEPLRTSLGSTVAESAFIGGKNLFVEGIADQVLIAGISNLLSRTSGGALGLDMNEVTIVPSGSASSLPYMVYLARGRGGQVPPCVALLDGDDAGRDAAKELRNLRVRKRHILAEQFILELGTWAEGAGLETSPGVVVKELEDLVPATIAVHAARAYARSLEGFDEAKLASLSEETLLTAVGKLKAASKGSLWDGLKQGYANAYPGCHIEKVGFAREVVEVAGNDLLAGVPELKRNFTKVILQLGDLLADAQQVEYVNRNQNRLKRIVAGFVSDHPDGMTRRRARSLLREIDQALDDSGSSDHLRIELAAIRKAFNLDTDLTGNIGDFNSFRQSIRQLEISGRETGREVATLEVQNRTE